MPGQTKTLRRRGLGQQLRALREAAGLTADQVAAHLGCSQPKVTRMETGRGAFKRADLLAMFDLFGLADATEREQLLRLAREANETTPLYSAALPSRLKMYLDLEREAAEIIAFDNFLVHGLLQTPDYARAIVAAEQPDAGAELADQVIAMRGKRQELLQSRPPLRLSFILDEVALHRDFGGPIVMREQLKHLVDAASWPNVTIQVVPLTVGAHAGVGGSFSVLRLRAKDAKDVLYVDGPFPVGNSFYEQPDHLHSAKQVLARLRAEALPPHDSIALIRSITRRKK
jgi:transcriptional regulator with XRE-family HTH domain